MGEAHPKPVVVGHDGGIVPFALATPEHADQLPRARRMTRRASTKRDTTFRRLVREGIGRL
jgi:hypothetical protein